MTGSNEPLEVVEPYVDCDHVLAPDLGNDVDDTAPELLAAAAAAGLRLVSRKAWGARAPRAAAARLSSTRGTKAHYTGGYVNPALLGDHRRCAPAVREIQRFHMDGNGWNDIGYTAVACPHRYVFVGRGPHALPAANGPGLNSAHYGVCALVGSKGVTAPVDGQLHALRDAVEWLRKDGSAGPEVKGHRDGYSTDCPGAALYAWVKKGATRPEEDDMEPTTNVDIPPFWEGKGFSHDNYSAAFLWAGSLSETRAYGQRILAELAAQKARDAAMQVTIDKLVDALTTGTPVDSEALKRTIRETIAEALTDEPA